MAGLAVVWNWEWVDNRCCRHWEQDQETHTRVSSRAHNIKRGVETPQRLMGTKRL